MTLAEGVKTQGQRDSHVHLGREHAQVYYFSMPMSAADFAWG